MTGKRAALANPLADGNHGSKPIFVAYHRNHICVHNTDPFNKAVRQTYGLQQMKHEFMRHCQMLYESQEKGSTSMSLGSDPLHPG